MTVTQVSFAEENRGKGLQPIGKWRIKAQVEPRGFPQIYDILPTMPFKMIQVQVRRSLGAPLATR